MQLSNVQRNVSTIGIQKSRKFSLRPGAHIMAILSGMYKDPKDAILREYLSNMYDAYVPLLKNGKSIKAPILRLPTKLNPVVEFQDFGIGMSFDTAWEVYAEYGNSTKNGDNDSVGGFGIGSKTAFCYNNGAAWNITTTKDGVTNYFQAFVGADGVPDLNHVAETREGLPNGTTVSIPVRVDDVPEFVEAGKKYIPYFPLDLTVEGIEADQVPAKPTYVFGGKEWGFSGKGHNTKVIMGNVPYDLDLSEVPNAHRNLDRGLYQFLTYNTIDLFVPIGAVDIVPSRDGLQMSDRTTKYLMDLFGRVWKELPKLISDKITAAPTLWAAACARNHAISQISGLTTDIVKGVKWNGVELGASLTFQLDELRKTIDVLDLTEYAIRNTDLSTPEVNEVADKVELLLPDLNSNGTNKHLSVIIINDVKGKASNIARGYVRDKYVAINTWSTSKRVQRYGHTKSRVYTLVTKASVDKIRAALGGFDGPVLKASELAGKVSKVQNAKTGNLYRWNGRNTFDARVNTPTGENEYHYVIVKKDTHSGRYYYDSTSWGQRNGKVGNLLSAAMELKINVKTLYGVRADDVASLAPEWQNLEELVADSAVTFLKTNLVGVDVYNANQKYWVSKHVRFFNDIVKGISTISTTDIQKDLKELNAAADVEHNHSTLIRNLEEGLVTDQFLKKVQSVRKPKSGAPVTDFDLINRIEAVVKKYPVLHLGWEIYKDMGYYNSDIVKKAIKKVGV